MKQVLIISFLLFQLFSGCEFKEQTTPSSLLQKAQSFEANDRLDSALVNYRMLYDSIKVSSNDSLKSECLLKIIDLERLLGNFGFCEKELASHKITELKGFLSLKVMMLKGNLLYDMGNYHDAEELVIALFGKLDTLLPSCKVIITECLDNQGKTELALNKFDKAETSLKQSLDIKKTFYNDKSKEIIQTKILLGALYSAKGDYDKALEILNEQLQNLQHRPLLKGTLLNYLGIVHYRLSDYNKASEEFSKSLEIRLGYLNKEHPLVADVYNNLGLLSDSYGEPELAIDHYTKALNIRIKNFGEKTRVIARNYNNLANACKDIKDYKRSLQYYRSAINILSEISPNDLDIGVVLINYGETYAIMENYKEAVECLLKAIAIQKKYFGNSHPWIAITYLNLGTAFADYNKETEARLYLNKSLSIAREVFKGKHQVYSQIYNEFGKLENRNKKYKNSVQFYQKALRNLVPAFTSGDDYFNPSLSMLNNDNLILETLILKAKSLNNLFGTRSDAVIQTYELIGGLIDKIRSGFKDETSRLLLSENISEVMEDAIDTYYRFYCEKKDDRYIEKAFAFCERSKALLLLETVLDNKAQKFGGIPDTLLKKEAGLKSRLSVLDKKVHDEGQDISSGDSLEYKQLQNSLIELKQEHLSLITYFEKNYPEYYRLKYNTRTADLHQLFRKLPGSSVMVEYFLGKRSVYIFTYDRGKLNLISVPIKNNVNNICSNFLKGIRELDFPVYAASAYELNNILIEPVKSYFTHKNLIIIPDGILNYIPFEALVSVKPDLKMLDYKKLHYLIYDYKMSYGYSAALLFENVYREGNLTDGSFIGFAPY